MTVRKEIKIVGNNRFYCLLALIAVLFSFQLQAQFYSIGVDPTSICWEQIESEHYLLIYPKDYQVEAKVVITKLKKLYQYVGKSLIVQPRKTTLILHNRTIESNGVTSYAPKRIELFTFQSNLSYAQPWMDQLITHEMRHICQMDKLNEATVRWLYYLFGEQVVGGIIGIYIPSWFFEGDAVLTETTLSKSGRGRTPLFTSELRTTLLARGVDNYSKALFGSYKIPVADAYQQGFMIVKEAEKQFGSDFWSNNLAQVSRNPFIPNPFFRKFKKQAGMSIGAFYNQTMSQLKRNEELRIKRSKIADATAISPKSKNYSSYESFAILNDSTTIAVKKQLHKTTQIVVIQNQKEQLLEENSLIVEGSVSCQGNIACWAERRYHPRWDQSSWIAIVTYDFTSKKRNVIIPKSRLQYPSLSSDACKIIAVNQSYSDTNTIRIYYLNGILEQEISAPQNGILMQPRWTFGDTAFVSILLTQKGKQLVSYSFLSKSWNPITQATFQDFLLWQIVGDSALITASNMDNTPICKVSLQNGGTNIIATRPFDINSAQTTSTNKLVCCESTAEGFKLYQILNCNSNSSIPLFSDFVKDEFSSINRYDSVVQFSETADTIYKAKPYRKIAHLFNFHSWGPISINADNQTVNPGVSITSQNLLSSSFFDAGITYSMAEQNTTYYTKYAYKGWFTEVSLDAQSTVKTNSETLPDNSTIQHTWNQSEYSLQFQMPLLFQTRKFLIPTTFSLICSDISLTPTSETPDNYKMGNLGAIHLRLYHGILKRKSFQALQPSLGYSIDVNYKTHLFGALNAGSIQTIESVLYFPGLFRNHGIQLYGGVQQLNRNQLYYSTLLSYPRGFVGTVRSDAVSASANYRFPIAYPDFSLGSILYLKRLRALAFVDYLQYKTSNLNHEYSSTGIELVADSYWFRFIAPITIGGRFSYSITEKSYRPELIFSINFQNL